MTPGARSHFAVAAVTVVVLFVRAIDGGDAGDHVAVGMKVKDDVRLGKETRAVIKVTSILGARYLQLEPAGDGSLENDNIDISRTEPPYDLQAALKDVTENYENFDAKQLASSLGVLGTQLKTLPPVVPQAMENVHTLSSIIADRRDQLGSLLSTTQTVTNTLHSQQATVGSLVRQGNSLVGEFVERRAAFHAMLASLTDLVQTLNNIVVNDRPQLEQTLRDLRHLSDLLAQHDDLLRSILQAAPVALRGLANATGTGNAADLNVPNGLLADSWMCAISGRAKQFNFVQYFQDCK